jgi:phosphatidylglycerol:prolipoprotein diacylglycerol transferase
VKPSLGVFFGLDLHTYGFAIAVGYALGVVLAVREARRRRMDGEAMLDLLFWILIAGLAGSRLLFVLVHAGEYVTLCRGSGPRSLGKALTDCAAPLKVWEGGLVFHGGVAGAALAVWRYCRQQRRSFAEVADVLTPPLALGHALGRLGCFFAGCCYGKPWLHGLRFPPGSVASDELAHGGVTVPLHPTQLYESLGELLIFFVLLLARRRLRFHGATALLYAFCYGLLRLAVELFRGDAGRGFIAGSFSTAQGVSLLLIAGAAVVFARRAAV